MIHLTNGAMRQAIAARKAARPTAPPVVLATVTGGTVSMTLQPPGARTAELAALVASADPALSARLRRLAAVERVHGRDAVIVPGLPAPARN